MLNGRSMVVKGQIESCINLSVEDSFYHRRYAGEAGSYWDLFCENITTATVPRDFLYGTSEILGSATANVLTQS